MHCARRGAALELRVVDDGPGIAAPADEYLAKPASVDSLVRALRPAGDAPLPAPVSGYLSVQRLEWEYIQRVLAHHEGNVAATARALGMHRRTLQSKLGKRPPGK